MNIREQLEILQRAAQKAIDAGWLQAPEVSMGEVDILLDPPALVAHRTSEHDTNPGDADIYLDSLFPLLDREFAFAFWGVEMIGNAYFGFLPAWKFHQHRLLEFVQNGEMDEFYLYIQVFI